MNIIETFILVTIIGVSITAGVIYYREPYYSMAMSVLPKTPYYRKVLLGVMIIGLLIGIIFGIWVFHYIMAQIAEAAAAR